MKKSHHFVLGDLVETLPSWGIHLLSPRCSIAGAGGGGLITGKIVGLECSVQVVCSFYVGFELHIH